ncbi:MAG: TPM domain-containing protein [Caulobacteraceae bacterium]|nr:TPM domain-containing protein [Caulobacter sp.]
MSRPRPPRAQAFPLAALVAAVLALALAWAVAPPRASAAPTYPPLTGRVVDDAHVLSADQAAELTQKLAALEQSTGRQLVVATVPSLQGYEIEEYGVGLLRAWGIGSKAKNDGAILIVAPTEKKVRVEVGYGLEDVLTDAVSALIIQHQVLPKFRAGDIGGGVVAGADALIAQLQLPPDQAQESAQSAAAERAQAAAQPERSHGIGGWIFLAFFGIWFLSTAWGFLTGHRGRRYGGGGGGWGWVLPMMLLNGLSSRGGRDDDWGGGGFGGGGGGFSGGGGSGGGGGASGSW